VAEQLTNLLGLNRTGSSGSSSNQSPRPIPRTSTPAPNPNAQPASPQQAAAQQSAQINVNRAAGSGSNSNNADGPEPIIQAIPRTNSIIVIARPLDLKYIEKLIEELDSDAPTQQFISRKLHYVDLRTFLEVAEKALLR